MKLALSRSAPLRLALVVSLAAVAGVRADEGMWMPRQIPELAPELAAAGMELDPAALTDLTGDPMGAVVSLGGCTASFVSPEGLVVTNHHCVYGTVQFNSTPERDLITLGFLAGSRGDELPAAPGSYVYVTTGIRDVTGEVLGEPKSVASDAELARQVERRSRQLVDACEKPGGVRCNVARFYEGSLFLEITQMEIRDVRLVYAPAEGIGNFGGETDNWMWPRHTGDFGFLRAYVGPDGRPADPDKANVPYRPKHWLKVATRGVQEGDLVWIPGYPGRTFRYRTGERGRRRAGVHDAAVGRPLEGADRPARAGEPARQGGRDRQLRPHPGLRQRHEEVRGHPARHGRRQGRSPARGAGVRAARGGGRRSAITAIRSRASPGSTPRIAPPGERDLVLDWLERASPMYAQAFKLWRLAEERPRPDLDREEGYRERDLSRVCAGHGAYPALDRAGQRPRRPAPAAGARGRPARGPAHRADRRAPRGDRQRRPTPSGSRRCSTSSTAARSSPTSPSAKRMAEETTAQLAARRDTMLDFARAARAGRRGAPRARRTPSTAPC